MTLKEKDLRKAIFPAPSEQLTSLINSYFARRYLDKSTDRVLGELETLLEEEGFDMSWIEQLYDCWSREQPEK
jgi:hypothetical protein